MLKRSSFFTIAALLAGLVSASPSAWSAPLSPVRCESAALSDRAATAIEITDLYQRGVTADAYNELLKDLQPGQRFRVGTNRVFAFKKLLNGSEATMNFIVETEDGFVLRIPKKFRPNIYLPRALSSNGLIDDAQTSFVDLQKELSEAGVSVVDLDLKQSHLPQFLVVGKLDIRYTLAELLAGETEAHAKLQITSDEKKRALKALIPFARSTWMYEAIGDFWPRQMGWVGDKWVLFDFDGSNRALGRLDTETNVFSPLDMEDDDLGDYVHKQVPTKLYEKLRDAIVDERAKQIKKHRWLKREYSNAGRLLLRASYPLDAMIGRTFYEDSYAEGHTVSWKSVRAGEKVPAVTAEGFLRFKILEQVEERASSLIFKVDLLDGTTGFIEILKKVYRKDMSMEGQDRIKWTFSWWPAPLSKGNDYRLVRGTSLEDVIK